MARTGSPGGSGRLRLAWLGAVGVALLGLLAGCASDGPDASEAAAEPDLKAEQLAADTLLALRTTPAVKRPPEPDWRDHFDDISEGGILVNLKRRYLGYWEPNAMRYHVFPIAVPLNEDLTRTGDTEIVRRRENPDWRPTPDMRKRNPKLPEYIGPGPDNPLGERALYLGWRYYAIHGTNNPDSIGAQATSGCIRMLPEDILWLYDRAMVGTPVRVLDDFEAGPPRAAPEASTGADPIAAPGTARYSAAVE